MLPGKSYVEQALHWSDAFSIAKSLNPSSSISTLYLFRSLWSVKDCNPSPGFVPKHENSNETTSGRWNRVIKFPFVVFTLTNLPTLRTFKESRLKTLSRLFHFCAFLKRTCKIYMLGVLREIFPRVHDD